MNSFVQRLALVLVLTLASIGIGSLVSQQGGRVALHADPMSSTNGISDFTWSPDGKSMAYISMQAGTSDLWIVPSSGGTPRRLVSGPQQKKQPRWSKDGKSIAFVGIQAGNAGEIFVANVADQTVINLSETPLDERNPAWAPDSKQIAFTQRSGNRTRVLIVDRETKLKRPLLDGTATDLSWSPDGKWLAYVADPLTNDGRRENSDIYIAPIDGGAPRLLSSGTPHSREASPSWSPDSRQIAFTSDASGYSNIFTIDVQNGTRKTITSGPVEFAQPRWSPDGTAIAFVRVEDARLNVWVSGLQNGRVSKISDRDGVNGGYDLPESEPRGKLEWSPDGKHVAFTHADYARTSDIWSANLDGTRMIQITNSMPGELRREGRFVTPEVTSYRSFDGTDVTALVYKPRGVKPKRGFPALLMFRELLDGQHTMDWNPFAQFFVSNGYLVFAPNVRGSSGRGRDYRQLVFQHGGDDDVRDAFFGLDRLSADGLIDTQRVAVFGSGTGGFLATAALVKDETRFRAAVVLNGIVDAVTAASYPGMGTWTRYMIGETPTSDALPFYERSLVNFVDKLRTPIIFFYSGDDPAAPFQQLQQFSVQADVKGKWFDYRVFDNEAEGWESWRPSNLRQTLEAMDALFEKHLLGHEREIRLTRNKN